MSHELKDYLLDIVKNTAVIDPALIIKVTGTEDSTTLKAKRADGTIILEGTLSQPVKAFSGFVFGFGNLPMLSGLLNFPNFRSKDGKVTMKKELRKDVEFLTEIVFEAPGNASASFRLVQEASIPKQYNRSKFEWAVVVEQPSKSKIAEFAQLESIYGGEEQFFTIKSAKGELRFCIGNENSSSHNASFVFADGIENDVKLGFSWKTADILKVLKLADSAKSTFKVSEQGVIQIDIDTGLCVYEFMFPGKN